MSSLCTNIKNTGLNITTMQIDTDGAGQSAVLPSCVTDSLHLHMLTHPSQIVAAFSSLGTAISLLPAPK